MYKIKNLVSTRVAGFTLLIGSILLLTGCGGFRFADEETIDPNDQTLSVIFGYFDVSESPTDELDWVSVKQYKPEEGYYGCYVENGMYYYLGVRNGSIQVNKLGRSTRWGDNVRHVFNFGGKGRNETARVIKKPGVYFLGSYKYKAAPDGSQFYMDKLESPTEKDLLNKLLKKMKEDNDLKAYRHQISMIEKRLRELSTK